MQVKQKVFILKKIRYGEADLIVQALAPTGARLSLYARAALKSRKRFGGGVLEPTHYVHALYDEKQGRGGDTLMPLREASLIEGFEGLRADYARLETALGFLQLVSDVSREGDVGSSDLFNLLGNALRACETSTALSRLRTHFQAKLLAGQGMLDHNREEATLLQAPIYEHACALREDQDWASVAARIDRALREYLDHLPDRSRRD